MPINENFEPGSSPDLRFIIGTPGADPSIGAERWLYLRTLDWLQWTYVRQIWKDTANRGGYSQDGNYAVRKSAGVAAIWDVANNINLFSATKPGMWQSYKSLDEYSWSQDPIFSRDDKTVALFWPYHFGELYLASIWSMPQKQEIGKFIIPASPSKAVAISPSGNQMVYPVPAGIEITELPTGKIVKTIVFGTCAGTIKLSPNGKLLASYYSQFIYICQAEDGKMVRSISVPTGDVTDIAWSPDSLDLASSGTGVRGFSLAAQNHDPLIHIWNVETGQELKALTGHPGDVEKVSYSPDGTTIASVGFIEGSQGAGCWLLGSGNEILLQRASDGKTINNIRPLNGMANDINFTPDSPRLMIASSGTCGGVYTIYFVDMQGHATKVADGGRYYILPGEKLLVWKGYQVSQASRAMIQEWHLGSNAPMLLTAIDFGAIDSYNFINILASSPDGKQLIFSHLEEGHGDGAVQRDIYLKNDLASSTSTLLLQDKENSWFLPEASVVFTKDGSLVLISTIELPGIIKGFKAAP